MQIDNLALHAPAVQCKTIKFSEMPYLVKRRSCHEKTLFNFKCDEDPLVKFFPNKYESHDIRCSVQFDSRFG